MCSGYYVEVLREGATLQCAGAEHESVRYLRVANVTYRVVQIYVLGAHVLNSASCRDSRRLRPAVLRMCALDDGLPARRRHISGLGSPPTAYFVGVWGHGHGMAVRKRTRLQSLVQIPPSQRCWSLHCDLLGHLVRTVD